MEFAELIEMLSKYIIVPLLIWALTEAHRYITAKVDGIKDKNIRDALNGAYYVLDDAVRSAIAQTEVSFVSIAKKHGRWDEDAQKEAKEQALGIAKTIVDDYSYELVETATGNVNAYIRAKIDEIIQGDK